MYFFPPTPLTTYLKWSIIADDDMVTAAVNKLNNTEASTQLCFNPTDTLKSSHVLAPATTTAFIFSCRTASMVKNLARQPHFLSTSHNSVLFIVSKAFVRSTKATGRRWSSG